MNESVLHIALAASVAVFAGLGLIKLWQVLGLTIVRPGQPTGPAPAPAPDSPDDPVIAFARHALAQAERARISAVAENVRKLAVGQFTPIPSVLPAESVPHPAVAPPPPKA